jgi:hypothetical protein
MTWTVFIEEPSPTAANATRFCLRTERTKPLRVRVSLVGEVWCEERLNSAAIFDGARVELY